MQGHLREGVVHLDGDARQRFYDSRGYGRPRDGNRLAVAPVEAAHLLSRGDLDSVDGMDFRSFLDRVDVTVPFVVYKDLRDRGFYLTPAREDWVDDPTGADFVVYPRGKGPWDDEVAHRVRVLGERATVRTADLGDVVLAIVDEEGELTYFETARTDAGSGEHAFTPPTGLDATLTEDRALLWTPPDTVYERGFYGQRLEGRHAEAGPLQVSLVEAAYLARLGAVSLDADAVVDRGRAVEGERFDRRLRVYAALRDAGGVPKSGFKFGADFRVYDHFESIDEMGHSDRLVRVVPPDHTAHPRDISLDVRLAAGVRKRMVFALTGANGEIDWLSVARLTP